MVVGEKPMLIDPQTTRGADLYQYMVRLIGPRPIAWISTRSVEGVSNLAPYSFFNGVTSRPPSLVFSSVCKPDGGLKDSLTNIVATGEFVVNVVPYSLAESMVATSRDWEAEIDEFEMCGIEATPSALVAPLRVARSPAAFECRLMQVVEVGSGPGAASLVIGEIVAIAIDDSVLGADNFPDPAALDLIGRMGGNTYARTTDRFDLERPS
ncbi:MAG: flavin reductase family protein [Pirellulaceae bacterium]